MPDFPEEVLTDRLSLKRIGADDLPDFLAFYQDEKTTATLGGVRSEERVHQWLASQLGHWQAHGFGLWTMREQATGQFIGRGGIQWADVEGKNEVELGYGLMPAFWRRGLATELSREALRQGFEVLSLNSIVAFTLPTNLRSRRVMEKVGLHFERDIVWADLPHVLYRIDRVGWDQLAERAQAHQA